MPHKLQTTQMSTSSIREGNGQLHTDSMEFLSVINSANLLDLGYSGSTFTWSRGNYPNRLIQKHFDRTFTNMDGRFLWPDGILNSPMITAPILFYRWLDLGLDNSGMPFRFEACWLKHAAFPLLIKEKWRNFLETPDALKF
ncbi:hypothetical protein V2J09_022934 [Rumex salicifolius]